MKVLETVYVPSLKRNRPVMGWAGRTKKEAQDKLKKGLTWSNCFDCEFKPSKKELSEYKIIKVYLCIEEK